MVEVQEVGKEQLHCHSVIPVDSLQHNKDLVDGLQHDKDLVDSLQHDKDLADGLQHDKALVDEESLKISQELDENFYICPLYEVKY